MSSRTTPDAPDAPPAMMQFLTVQLLPTENPILTAVL